MGTKNNPGKFDCYAKAHPDEPVFVLRGQDKLAPSLVKEWALMFCEVVLDHSHTPIHCHNEKVKEALACAKAMEEWQTRKLPD